MFCNSNLQKHFFRVGALKFQSGGARSSNVSTKLMPIKGNDGGLSMK
jgi:hypothetical protein